MNIVLENKLIITRKTEKERVLQNSDKMIVELNGNEIKSWYDFYQVIQKNLDYWNYDAIFGECHPANIHTYADIVQDEIIFEKFKEDKQTGLIITLDYTAHFRSLSKDEKNNIYTSLFHYFLLEWYRELRIMSQDHDYDSYMNVEVYFFVEDKLLKDLSPLFRNELIVATNSDLKNLKTEEERKNLLEVFFVPQRERSFIEELRKQYDGDETKVDISLKCREERIFLNQLEDIVKKKESESLEFFIQDSDSLWERDNIWGYLIENILIERFLQGKETTIYSVFKDEIW